MKNDRKRENEEVEIGEEQRREERREKREEKKRGEKVKKRGEKRIELSRVELRGRVESK